MMMNSFEGPIQMYEEEIFVNKETRLGYEKVLAKIDPLINGMAAKAYIPGHTFDDIKQELLRMAVEGIDSYNHDKSVKLSTFLHIHLRNKLISFIKHHNKISTDASYHDTSDYGKCDCGGVLKPASSEPQYSDVTKCPDCKKEFQNSFRRSREEIVFSSISISSDNSEEQADFESIIANEDGMFQKDGYASKEVDIHAIISLIEKESDSKTAHLLRRTCVDGLPIKEAAAEVGLTGWAASVRIKRLSENEKVRELLKELY